MGGMGPVAQHVKNELAEGKKIKKSTPENHFILSGAMALMFCIAYCMGADKEGF